MGESDLLRAKLKLVPYFDKLLFRMARKLTKSQLAFLRGESNFVAVRRGHHIRNSLDNLSLVVVNPTQCGLEFLAEHARLESLKPNYVEPALDVIVPDEKTPYELCRFFDRHFVEPWHGKHDVIRFEGGTTTGQRRPGKRFEWYFDRPSKRTGDPFCFHFEGRHQGMAAVRRVGIHEPNDLLEFDHISYWNRYLKFFDIDLERLGRWHLNRCSGQRRRKARVIRCGPLNYNIDRATGQILYRIFSEDCSDKYHSVRETQYRSLQAFVDCIGRGPYLVELDASALLPS